MSFEIPIDPSVTTEQRQDARLLALKTSWEHVFSTPSREHNLEMLRTALHEMGHAFYLFKLGISVQYAGPVMRWEKNYDAPVLFEACVNIKESDLKDRTPLEVVKVFVAGSTVLEALTSRPDDPCALEGDLQIAREIVQISDEDFSKLVEEAKSQIIRDLRSPTLRHDLWERARDFVENVYSRPEPLAA